MKKAKKKKSVASKLISSAIIVALVIGASYLVYYLINYTFNNKYKEYIVGTTYRKGSEFKVQKDSARPDNLDERYQLAVESESLKLYVDIDDAEIAIYDKNSGNITYSNPQNIEEKDYTNLTYFKEMSSQLKIGYYKDKTSKNEDYMTSYEFCTNVKPKEGEEEKDPQFKFESLTDKNGKVNGLRVIYTIGNLNTVNGSVPEFFTEKTFNEVISKLENYDKENGTRKASTIKNKYSKSKDKKGCYQRSAGIKKAGIRDLQKILELIDWTMEDFENEIKETGEKVDIPVSFTIPLEYTLDNDKLETNIVTNKIVEAGGAYISFIEVLPYFGAVYHTTEDSDACKIYVKNHVDTTDDAVATEDDAAFEGAEYFVLSDDSSSFTIDTEFFGENSVCSVDLNKTSVDPETNEVVLGETVKSYGTAQVNNIEYVFDIEKNTNYVLTVNKLNGPVFETYLYDVSIVPDSVGTNGYYFVPNGSGSLIKFNSINCDDSADYTEHFYGVDEVMADAELSVQETTPVKLPVYGWATDESTILVILTRGESFADLKVQTANITDCRESTSLCNYNSARCRYYLRTTNVVSMNSADEFTTWNDKIFKTELTQLYCFLPEDQSGYVGMANYYRNYLVENGKLKQNNISKSDDIGMYLDFIGAVKGDSSFLGFTYEAVIPMTTFDQAKEIVKMFNKNKVNKLIVNYQGWMNDGYNHDTVDDISVIGKLGGRSDFEELSKLIEKNGGKLYGDMAITRISFDAEDYKYNNESSRIYGSGFVAAFGKTSPLNYNNAASLGYKGNLYNIVSPKFYPKYIESMIDEMKDIKITGISFRDFASTLNADMKKTNIINREEAKEVIVGLFDKKIAKSKNQVMLNAPFAYALPYANDIINAPIGDNNYIYVDTEVPFYEMVIHGYINYSGSAINLAADTTTEENILECIEYGACPHFTLTYEPASKMKYTALNNMYSTHYKNWVEEAVNVYADVNNGLSNVIDAKIVNHEILDPGKNKIRKVTYDNGVVFVVNYSKDDYNYNGKTVPAKGWLQDKE